MVAPAHPASDPQVGATDGDDWLFEIKLDGIRVLAIRDGTSTRLYTRNGCSQSGNQQVSRARGVCGELLVSPESAIRHTQGFELPVPRGLIRAQFDPSLAHYSVRIKASVLERLCSLRIRLFSGSLRLPSFARQTQGIFVRSNLRRRFEVRISASRACGQ